MPVFGHAESVEDCRDQCLPVHHGGAHEVARRDSGDFGHAFRRVVLEQPEQLVVAAGVGFKKGGVHEPLADQEVGQAVEHGHVGSGPGPQVDVGVPGQVRAPGIQHHQAGAVHDPLEDP